MINAWIVEFVVISQGVARVNMSSPGFIHLSGCKVSDILSSYIMCTTCNKKQEITISYQISLKKKHIFAMIFAN